jgi:predicted nuclease of predicted toxin-antitoxin system
LTAFLLDANLSPETAEFLRNVYGFDVVDLQSLRLGSLGDEQVIELATEQNRIITQDLDFGARFHHAAAASFGPIVLRLSDQTVGSVNRRLDRFFRHEASDTALEQSLVVLTDERTRIVTKGREVS